MQEFSMILSSWSMLGLEIPAGILRSFYDATVCVLPYFSQLDLLNTWRALSTWQCKPPDAWLDAFYKRLQPQLCYCSPKDLVYLLHTAVQLGSVPPREWMEAYEEVCIRRVRNLALRDIARLVEGYRLAGLLMGPDLLQELGRLCNRKRGGFINREREISHSETL
jgi:hypothetical protein